MEINGTHVMTNEELIIKLLDEVIDILKKMNENLADLNDIAQAL